MSDPKVNKIHTDIATLLRGISVKLNQLGSIAAENLKEIMLRRQRLVMNPEKEFSWSDNKADPIDLTAPG